jgi:hypothetical protein
MDKARAARKKLLAQYGDWISSSALVLGDRGFRIEISLKVGGKAHVPKEIDGFQVVIR